MDSNEGIVNPPARVETYQNSTHTDGPVETNEDGVDVTRVSCLADAMRLSFRLRDFAGIIRATEAIPVTKSKMILAFVGVFSMWFNVYFMSVNFQNRKDFDSDRWWDHVDNANWAVVVVEFSVIIGALVWLFVWLFIILFVKNEPKYLGGNFFHLSRTIIFIANWSLVKGCADMKLYANYCADYWLYVKSDRELNGSTPWQIPTFIFWSGLKFFWIIFSIVAFIFKLSQVSFASESVFEWTWAQRLVFIGFLNNMVSLYNPWAIQLDSIYKFMFAGPDAQFQANEKAVLREFQECLVYRVIKKNGIPKGMVILLCWSYFDVQGILLEENGKFRVDSIDDDAPVPESGHGHQPSSALLRKKH